MSYENSITSLQTGDEVLLTVAIPTYNRASYLEQCLQHLFSQASGYGGRVEVIVSDNCSTDGTGEVVRRCREEGRDFRYVRNDENIGVDRNFAQCFTLARGKYVLLFGDDDLLLDGAMDRIMAMLTGHDYGVLYLNSYGFNDDYRRERPAEKRRGTVVFRTPQAFVERTNFWLTFASGNIVNKSLVPAEMDPCQFVGTNLVQLNWVFSALFTARENAVIEEYLVAYKMSNTGGYKLCQVFGEHMNAIFDVFVGRGYDREPFNLINRKLVLSFFPNLILITRRQGGGFNFEAEDYYSALSKVFSGYAGFWLVTMPAIALPLRVAKLWVKLVAKVLG